MALQIRPATAEDAHVLADLATQLGYPSQPAQIARRLALLPSLGSHVFVAEAEGRVVGFVQVSVYFPFLMDDAAEIAALVVDERWRGQGIGHALLQAAEAWAVEHGCTVMHVRTNIIRERAHAFYRREGYAEVKTALTLAKALR
ncbi:MAG: GNAT family N-acetyltransferase [Chloroflexi bacterium]|nr:GNAT family N-acetyltransferase [Chloroflexota bacterium]